MKVDLTENDILSLEAVLYACAMNKRTTTGGYFVKNIMRNKKEISFNKAMENVAEMIEKFYADDKAVTK